MMERGTRITHGCMFDSSKNDLFNVHLIKLYMFDLEKDLKMRFSRFASESLHLVLLTVHKILMKENSIATLKRKQVLNKMSLGKVHCHAYLQIFIHDHRFFCFRFRSLISNRHINITSSFR